MIHQSDSDLEFDDDDTDEYNGLFTLAAEHIESIHDKLMPNDLLELYGLYKQATCGECTTPKPNIFNMQARAKWSAWHNLNDQVTRAKAKQLYFEKVQQIDPAWWEKIQSGIDGGKSHLKSRNNWVVHSIPALPADQIIEKSDMEKTIFDFVRERNLTQVKKMFKPSIMDVHDDCGMALIHWATDANDVDMVKFLLESGCPVDIRDKEQQQTALHYAASCGHVECLRLLLEYGANKSIKDIDGQTCCDVADDPLIRSLLQS